jgi:hypothetical protein
MGMLRAKLLRLRERIERNLVKLRHTAHHDARCPPRPPTAKEKLA